MNLAQSVAIGFWKKAPNVVDRGDAISVAYQGLVTAALRFDPDYRPPDDPKYDPFLAFGPYARLRITGAVQDWLRSLDHVPKRQRRTYKDIQRLGPGRSPEEVAVLLDMDVAKVRAITHAVETPPISLDEWDVRREDMPLSRARLNQLPRSSSNTEADSMVSIVQEAVGEAFCAMDPLHKSVLALRYYMGYTYQRIAEELEISVTLVKEVNQEATSLIHSVVRDVVTS